MTTTKIILEVRIPLNDCLFQETKVEKRDPRFDPLCGEFDKAEFRFDIDCYYLFQYK